MPALEMHKAKLLLAAAADRLPDVASVDSFWMPLFMEGHHVQPLDPYWPAEDRADYVPFAIDTLSDTAGHVYGMWHGTDCRDAVLPEGPRARAPADLGRADRRSRARISREKKIAGYLYNAGRWEAAVFDHLGDVLGTGRASWWTTNGRPVFGEPPNREKMVRVLSFLRETLTSGRLAAGRARPQRLPAAHVRRHRGRRGDVPGRQLAAARPRERASARGVREVGRRPHPAGGGRAAERARAAGSG